MKKKILIVSHALEIGGAERSLIGLLDALDSSEYDIDLFLLRHEGEFMKFIPQSIHVLPQESPYTVLARPMKEVILEGHIILAMARLWGKTAAFLYNRLNHYKDSVVSLDYSHKFTCPFMPPIKPDVEYDLAISFLTPHYFVNKKVLAKKKIAWIHTDYSIIDLDIHSEMKMWEAYDKIIAVSDAVKEKFVKVFPALKKKLMVIENIISKDIIKNQVKEEIPFERGKISLLSIGRYCVAKNFDSIPEICRYLLDIGHNVVWYIIGYGSDEDLIIKNIEKFKVKEQVILLGKKDNPYPYISACTLYVQPSRYEGKSVTVREAQMLGKPVVITRYATSSGQVAEGEDGIIVPMDNKECANGISLVLKDTALMKRLSKTCLERDFSNRPEVEKIYEMLK